MDNRWNEFLSELKAGQEEILRLLKGRNVGERKWYTTEQFAAMTGLKPDTVREYCREGRIAAEKRHSGRGAYMGWVIGHAEYERYLKEGLRPPKKP